nr:putative F-box protein At3g52320 [Ipomoea batatas]
MTGVSTLPQEILMEILSKLPAKSLVRFRCVSKSFAALIADHDFGVLNRSFSLTLPSRAGFLISIEVQPPHPPPYRRVYYTLNFSDQENPRRRGMLQANRVGFLGAEPFLLSSSSDGLICVSKFNGDVDVCNVSTGQRIFLPRLIRYRDCALLLGYDSQSKRYKVLMSVEKKIDRESTDYEYKQWIFTVGVDRSWREIKNYDSFPFYPINCYRYNYYSNNGVYNSSVYIDSVIYSYNMETKYSEFRILHIVAFDIGCESFSVITLPDEVSSQSYLFLQKSALLEVGGRLAMVLIHVPTLFLVDGLFYLNVWTWEKSKKCWEMIIVTIPLEYWSKIICNASVRFATNHDGEIVLLCIHSKQFFILVYNLTSEVWRKFDVSGVEVFPIFSCWDVTLHNFVDQVFPLEKLRLRFA